MEPVIAGHPIHATLIPLPVGTLPASYMLDLAALATDSDGLADAAFYTMLIGSASAIPAALTGFWDYLSMAKNDPAQKTAVTHGLMNGSLLTLYTLNLLVRARNRRSKLGFLLSTIGTAGLVVSGYLGGEIAYGRGWRVRSTERFELEWQKQRQVGPFIESDGNRPTEQEFPPEVIKGLHVKEGSQEIFEEVKNSKENSSMSQDRPTGGGQTGQPDNQSKNSEQQRQAAQQGAGTRANQEDRPSQAEGDRNTVEDSLQDGSPS